MEASTVNTSELTDLIKSRRSIRVWQDKQVSEELLSQAIELATYAQNGGNQQNWHFYVIVNKQIINLIAETVQANGKMIGSWPETEKYPEFTSRMLKASGFFRTAPAAIAVAAKQYKSPLDEILLTREKIDQGIKHIRQGRDIANSRIQSVASAIAYLMLILHQMGLGAVWMTDPMRVKIEIENILDVPKDMDVVAFIPVGYPVETPPLRARKPVKEICQIIK
jgi:nitroreductase